MQRSRRNPLISSVGSPSQQCGLCTLVDFRCLPVSPGFNLYTHLFRSALFPLGSSVNLYVLFSCRESISSCMTLNHFRLWVSSFSSSKLSGSPSSISSTCSSSRNLWGPLLSLRGYLQPWFSTTGSLVGSSSESGFGILTSSGCFNFLSESVRSILFFN